MDIFIIVVSPLLSQSRLSLSNGRRYDFVTKIIDFPPLPDNISIKIFVTSDCSCITCLKFGFHAATAIHEPSGESNEVVLIIRELPKHALAYELLEDPLITAVRGLREKMDIKDNT